jgi:hypothetical protein
MSEKIEHPDTAAFKTWLRTAKPGETYIYYTGRLAENRMELTAQPSSYRDRELLPKNMERGYDFTQHKYLYFIKREPLNSYAQAVWQAYIDGRVELTQKRLEDGTYMYRATKRRNVKPVKELWI